MDDNVLADMSKEDILELTNKAGRCGDTNGYMWQKVGIPSCGALVLHHDFGQGIVNQPKPCCKGTVFHLNDGSGKDVYLCRNHFAAFLLTGEVHTFAEEKGDNKEK